MILGKGGSNMTINDFIKMNNFPEVIKLGKIKNTTYYIEKNLSDEETGIPFIIQEIDKRFKVCTSDEALNVISIFGGDEL